MSRVTSGRIEDRNISFRPFIIHRLGRSGGWCVCVVTMDFGDVVTLSRAGWIVGGGLWTTGHRRAETFSLTRELGTLSSIHRGGWGFPSCLSWRMSNKPGWTIRLPSGLGYWTYAGRYFILISFDIFNFYWFIIWNFLALAPLTVVVMLTFLQGKWMEWCAKASWHPVKQQHGSIGMYTWKTILRRIRMSYEVEPCKWAVPCRTMPLYAVDPLKKSQLYFA